jgi:hypothetical protein
LRPTCNDKTVRHGKPLLWTVRQLTESANDTLKGQLDLEAHGGHTFNRAAIPVAQHILAMTAGIWHNEARAPVTRSLIAYHH